jgi:crotonobetainyl-CoA:carnitine CoA-transferase CaiB-like acyl-CoA transferase
MTNPVSDNDPYLWLEDVEGERALSWVREQNAQSLAQLESDPRFAARESRKKNRAPLKAAIEAGLASRSAAEWEALCNAVGVPAGQVLSVPQILASEQLAERDFIHEFAEVPGLDAPARMTRAPYRLNGAHPAPAAPPPLLGQDTEAWLTRLGVQPADIARLRAEGAV